MAMVMVAAILLIVITDDEDDDNDDVKAESEPIVDWRRRPEQHNIMSGITGAAARRKIKNHT